MDLVVKILIGAIPAALIALGTYYIGRYHGKKDTEQTNRERADKKYLADLRGRFSSMVTMLESTKVPQDRGAGFKNAIQEKAEQLTALRNQDLKRLVIDISEIEGIPSADKLRRLHDLISDRLKCT